MTSYFTPTCSCPSPQVSVLLPVYNAERYLEQAIDSVLAQTFSDFELLLLNDGSSDNSLKIIQHYCSLDSRCRALTWDNRGLVKTLNAGIEEARGKIIIRMDADDICLPHRFEKQIKYLNEHPECVAIGSRVLLIDPEGLSIMEMGGNLSHEDIDAGNLSGEGSVICHPAVAMRRDAVMKVGGYRTEYKHAEDVDLFLRMGEIGRLANLPEVLLAYRQHPTSVGYASRLAQVNSTLAAVQDARRRRNLSVEIPMQVDTAADVTPDMASIHRKWAWWALGEGHVITARKHARKALTANPMSWQSWKLLLCVLRGY